MGSHDQVVTDAVLGCYLVLGIANALHGHFPGYGPGIGVAELLL